jgi:hypothetical protein
MPKESKTVAGSGNGVSPHTDESPVSEPEVRVDESEIPDPSAGAQPEPKPAPELKPWLEFLRTATAGDIKVRFANSRHFGESRYGSLLRLGFVRA